MIDKKKILESILKEMEQKGGSLEVEVGSKKPMENESDYSKDNEVEMELEVAAEDVLKAIERQDAKSLAIAMKALVEMC